LIDGVLTTSPQTLTNLIPGIYGVGEEDPGSDWIVSGEGYSEVVPLTTANRRVTNTYSPPSPGPGPFIGDYSYRDEPYEDDDPGIRYFTVNFLGEITQEPISTNGRLLGSLEAPSPDGTHLFVMDQGTLTTDAQGDIVTQIIITDTLTPPLPGNTIALKTYSFEPSGISFDRSVRLSLGYSVDQLPEDVTSVSLSYYTAGGWTDLQTESGTVAEVGQVSAPVDHFTIFAILARVSPSAAPPASVPANIELSNLSIRPSLSTVWEWLTFMVRSGQDVTVTVDATNHGGQAGSLNAALKLNDVIQETKDVNLGAGQSQNLVFTLTQIEPGTYVVEIGDLSGEFTSLLWTNWWLVAGFTGLLILLIWAAWHFGRKLLIK
jgi:hypothetical protein